MQWEYLVVQHDKVKRPDLVAYDLNRRGAEGWELVSLTPVSDTYFAEGSTTKLMAVFKRPVVPATAADQARRVG